MTNASLKECRLKRLDILNCCFNLKHKKRGTVHSNSDRAFLLCLLDCALIKLTEHSPQLNQMERVIRIYLLSDDELHQLRFLRIR